jgi:2-polyprenyl-6-methoxyphenol hydroxylase-like FAD-dependent oxidoreductase
MTLPNTSLNVAILIIEQAKSLGASLAGIASGASLKNPPCKRTVLILDRKAEAAAKSAASRPTPEGIRGMYKHDITSPHTRQ